MAGPYAGLISAYQGAGLASARPTTPNLMPGAMGEYYATDTTAFSVWDGAAWHTIGGGGGVTVQDEGTPLGTATAINFVGTGVTATFSAGVATVTIPGGGGSSKWTLLNSWDFAVSGAISQLDTTGITNDEVLIIGQAVTKSASGKPLIYFSINNGVSYDTTTTNYLFINSSGGTAANSGVYLDNGITTAATSGQTVVTALQETGPKIALPNTANAPGYQYIGAATAINALRIIPSGGGTFNGGKLFVYGRN